MKVAPAMSWLSRFALPLVWLLDASGKTVLALLGQKGVSEETVTDEEIRTYWPRPIMPVSLRLRNPP